MVSINVLVQVVILDYQMDVV